MHAERANLVAGGAQRRHHIVFGFPDVDFLLGIALARFRRYQVRVNEQQDAQLFHSAIHLRRDGPNSVCMVLAVNSTVNSMISLRSAPTARRLSSRQRWIISSSTTSKVS